MDAILLAGGYGTRLRPLTYTRPKPLLPVAGRPMLEWVLDRLPPQVDHVVVAVNWLAKDLNRHFAASDREMEFTVVREDKPLGTGGAMRNCLDALSSDRTFALFADIVSGFELQRMVHLQKEQDAAVVMALREVAHADTVHFGCARIGDKTGAGVEITDLVEKPASPALAPSRLINAGAYFLRTDVLESIPTDRLVSFEKEVLPRVWGEEEPVWGVPYTDPWIDVGDPKRLLEAARFLSPEYVFGPDSDIHPDAILQDTLTGQRCTVGKQAVLHGCILGDDVKVDPEVRLTNCVIGDGEHVKASAEDAKIWTKPMPKGYPEKQVGNAMAASQ